MFLTFLRALNSLCIVVAIVSSQMSVESIAYPQCIFPPFSITLCWIAFVAVASSGGAGCGFLLCGWWNPALTRLCPGERSLSLSVPTHSWPPDRGATQCQWHRQPAMGTPVCPGPSATAAAAVREGWLCQSRPVPLQSCWFKGWKISGAITHPQQAMAAEWFWSPQLQCGDQGPGFVLLLRNAW